jgi:uncharacterized membrane protein
MKISYSHIAGSSVERLAALSDGIFAVAMTLLVLELHAPAKEAIHGDADLWMALGRLAPAIATCLLSFLTLGIFWNGQQAQISRLDRSDRHLTWMHIGFLFPVSILPFSTTLLAEFIELRLALLVYWITVLASGLMLYICWSYTMRHKLARTEVTPTEDRAIRRRIVVAQSLYAAGAALCLWTPWASIVAFILIQINFAIGPRSGWLSRV